MILKEIYRLAILELKEAGINSAQLDARVLICSALDISIEKFYLIQNDRLSPNQTKKIKLIIKKRAQNMPVAYILGHKEFYGFDFMVDKNVLIPRPETEGIVDKSIKSLKSKVHKVEILDIGTGCGNIIIAIACHSELARNLSTCLSHLQFFASDISPAALKIARQNAKFHQVEGKIKFIQSDLFSKLKNQKFDLIIANLPYVPNSDTNEKSIQFEPKQAIFADKNGADIIKKFLKQAPDHLNYHGSILLELDPRNAFDIETFAQKYFPKSKIKLSKDLAGLNRYLTINQSPC